MNETLYIGLDLGSFKLSVASSNGRRDELPTAVGLPKDHVAQTMLGREVVFGKDVWEHRRALNVIRPFEKGVLKYVDYAEAGLAEEHVERHKDAARMLVQHAVSLMEPPAGAAVYGVIGAPSRASIMNKQLLIEIVENAFDAVAIVSEPFTVAYGMNRLRDTLVIDIGAGTIDICPIYGTYPTEDDQVTIPLGGDLIDEEFCKRLREAHPGVQLSRTTAREIKEKHGFVHNVNETAPVTLLVNGKPTPLDVARPLKEACQTIVGPIIDGLRESIARLDPEYQLRILNNILIAGGGSQLKGLDRLLEDALQEYGGGKVSKVFDCVFAGAVGALKLAMTMPTKHWNELKSQKEQHVAV